jgi:hypothetical protein
MLAIPLVVTTGSVTYSKFFPSGVENPCPAEYNHG